MVHGFIGSPSGPQPAVPPFPAAPKGLDAAAGEFYRLGTLLLDIEDPSRVLHRTPDWSMQPETDCEIEGFYRGVCFPCGAVVINGTLFVYCGGGDNDCAVAAFSLDELVRHLLSCPG